MNGNSACNEISILAVEVVAKSRSFRTDISGRFVCCGRAIPEVDQRLRTVAARKKIANCTPCCMTINLQPGDCGTYLLVADDGREALVQTDWDFPGVASTFGWVPCECGHTDGTVDCRHKTASKMIAEAAEYLGDHVGDSVDGAYSMCPATVHSPLLQVPLVILLGPPKGRGGHDRGNNRPLVLSARFKLFFGRDGHRLLLGAVVEDDRAVLGANVRPLPVRRRRVVVVPEYVEQFFIRNLGRIVLDLDCFGMPGSIRANVFVGRVFQSSSRISHRGRGDALRLAERLFHSPETAGGKGRHFHFDTPCFVFVQNASLICRARRGFHRAVGARRQSGDTGNGNEAEQNRFHGSPCAILGGGDRGTEEQVSGTRPRGRGPGADGNHPPTSRVRP